MQLTAMTINIDCSVSSNIRGDDDSDQWHVTVRRDNSQCGVYGINDVACITW